MKTLLISLAIVSIVAIAGFKPDPAKDKNGSRALYASAQLYSVDAGGANLAVDMTEPVGASMSFAAGKPSISNDAWYCLLPLGLFGVGDFNGLRKTGNKLFGGTTFHKPTAPAVPELPTGAVFGLCVMGIGLMGLMQRRARRA